MTANKCHILQADSSFHVNAKMGSLVSRPQEPAGHAHKEGARAGNARDSSGHALAVSCADVAALNSYWQGKEGVVGSVVHWAVLPCLVQLMLQTQRYWLPGVSVKDQTPAEAGLGSAGDVAASLDEPGMSAEGRCLRRSSSLTYHHQEGLHLSLLFQRRAYSRRTIR